MDVTINDNRLNVKVLGDNPDAPVLIAHHGAPGLGSMNEPEHAFGFLADEFRVVVFDARGSGTSEGKPPFTHEQWAADVDGLREWMGVDQVVMAGGSYGGFIAMEYAIRYPERVRALVLRDTAPDGSNQEAANRNALNSSRVDVDRDKLERMMSGTIRDNDDFADCWLEILPLYDHDFDPDRVSEKHASTPYRYETHNYAFAHNQPSYDISPQLPSVTCPALVTVGRHDWITPVECSEKIASLVPGAELVVFEDSGHNPAIEEAARFQQVVRAFLDKLPAPQPVS